MYNPWFVFSSLLLSTSLVSGQWLPALAQEEPLRVGIYQNEPKVFLTETGEPSGFWPELLAAIATAEGWSLDYVPCEWDDCLEAVEAGQLDLMLDVSYSRARTQRFDFNSVPVVSTWSVIYVSKGTTLDSLVDLNGLRLGVLADGVQYDDLSARLSSFDVSVDFRPAADYDTLLQWLDEGEIDAVAINRFTGALAERQHPIQPTDILVAPTQVHFIAPSGQNADVLAAIDRHLQQLKDDPNSAYYDLRGQWLVVDEPFDWPALRRGAFASGAVALMLLLLSMILWNRRLQTVVWQRTQAEAALRESEGWLKRVLSIAEIICWEEDLVKGKIRTFGLQAPTGWQPEHWETSTDTFLSQIIHPDDEERMRAARASALETGGELVIEHRVCLSQREVLWVLTTGQVIPDETGQPLQIIGSSLNITERKKSEQSLQTSKEQLSLSIEVGNIGIWTWYLATDKVEWNNHHFRLLGLEPGEIAPDYHQWRRRVHPDDRDRIDAAVKHALETRLPYAEEYRIVCPDGTVRWVLGHGRYLANQQGEGDRMIGVMLDITQSKQTEAALRQSEATKQQVLEAIPDLLVWMRADGICEGVATSEYFTNALSPSLSIGSNQYEVLPPALAALRRQAIAAVLLTGRMQRYEQTVEVDGSPQYEEVRVVPLEADRVLVMIRDISDRKRAELALAESEQRYRMVTENMTDLVCLHDPQGQYLYVTPSCQLLLGYTQPELIGQDPYQLFHPNDIDSTRRAHELALAGTATPVRYRIRHRSGNYIWLETLTKPIWDEAGHLIHLQTTSREVTDQVRMEQQLRHDALHDALTRLPNRLLLMERLELAIKRTQRHPEFQFALLFIDFDRFKFINDSLGHLIGDELLINIAQRFSELLRETDLVARIGGDEFVLLLEETNSCNEAIHVAERVLQDLQTPFCIQGQEIFTSASIGIVMGSVASTTADVLLRDADIAMYQAKAKGHQSSYVIFDPAMHIQVLNRLQLENDLRRAIDQSEFVLYYQPIVSLSTLKIVGFESLIRWQHPTKGLLTPDKFIATVEETDLILPIGAWTMLTACQQVSQWQAQNIAGPDLHLTVNLSVKQLWHNVLIQQLEQALQVSQIRPGCLTLEITESLLMENIEATHELLQQVQAMGANISIDDFGTGYSSLSYLHQLPVDSLKIDRAFVSPPVASHKNRAIAESIVGLSNLLGLDAIAEGIETPEQLDWLRSLHCEYGQGYLFAKPLPAEQAEHLLRTADVLDFFQR